MGHLVLATASSQRLWHRREHPRVRQNFGLSGEPVGPSADVFRGGVGWVGDAGRLHAPLRDCGCRPPAPGQGHP